MKATVQIDTESHELAITRRGNELRVAHHDGTQTATVQKNGRELHLTTADGRSLRVIVHTDGDNRQIWIDGRTLTYKRIRRTAQSAQAAAGSLSADIPAVVTELLVGEGDQVTAGQKLILLESMKMVIPIIAPLDGTVEAIHCAAGDAVQPGVPLVELDPA